ncbi:palmitoyl-acyl carrier protein thioesterase, chloroplastic-like [Rutidosis leptorrhynchoides]|uniref:palmitoyl-acyl carrier protein thioesterase, chloroplastic-like n=1 Tax=Rutidosis leptorrhynchoides TaxID=125765 RepID=UPI003A9991F9
MVCAIIGYFVIPKQESTMVMMNKETRRLAKFPSEVRVEYEKYLRYAAFSRTRENKIPRWDDLDVHQHVNNVKYIGWILQSVPRSIMKNYELVNVKLEYQRECTMDSVLQSSTFVIGTENGKTGNNDHVDCKHLLELEPGSGCDEIAKAKTSWRLKHE